MNSRRGFFKSLAKAAAIISLAPQIAFRVKPETWVVREVGVYEMLRMADGHVPRSSPGLDLYEMFRLCHEIRHRRQSAMARAASPS